MKAALLLSAIIGMAAVQPAANVVFEKQPQALHGGKSAKSPKFLARRAQGLMSIYTVPGERGADLFYSSSNDVGETWSEPLRVNAVPGEVSDHGENSPQLFLSPDEMTLYAFWNARDPKNPGASHVRFAKAGAMITTWTPAITLDDDTLPNSHGFQGAAVGPDGTLYAAWLDGRDKEAAKTRSYTAGASAVYLTRSADGGKTWTKNVRIATDVCPCCRVSFGFLPGKVLVAWRGVDDGDLRDIYTAASSDSGASWSAPVLVNRDNWKIKGCPHVGPSLATVGDKLQVVWFSEADGKPGIYISSTTNGTAFTAKRILSEGTVDPTHPMIASDDNRIAVAFQARDAEDKDSWGKMSIYYRELHSNGTLSPLIKAGVPKDGSVTYPSLALGMSGRTFLGWTENRGEQGPQALLLRGRLSSR
jgi:hypothetical protein